jgi:outer membrane protein assembly factor BamB
MRFIMRFLLTACLFTASSLALAADWPGFRGTGDGVASEKSLPLNWSETENIAWTADLPGYGQSAPVVWKGTVYITAVEGPDREKGFVAALDAKTGKEKWRHTFEPTQKAKWATSISRGAPTPLVDADGVYAFFEGGNLLAFTHDGKLRWERSLVTEYGKFEGNHGIGASPCQTADTVFVLIDHAGPCYLLAVDKATGKNKWKTDRTKRTSWASPVIATRSGKPEVVVSSNGSVAGYDPATGKQLWELTGITGNTLPSASANGDRILVGAGAARGTSDPKAASKSNCCLTLADVDGKPAYKVAWSAESATANYATPLAHEGHAYFVNATGVFYCLDLKTGKEQYSERLPAACWASPIAVEGRVYCFAKDGRTAVIKTGAEFEVLATNRLWDPAKAKPKAEGEPKGK